MNAPVITRLMAAVKTVLYGPCPDCRHFKALVVDTGLCRLCNTKPGIRWVSRTERRWASIARFEAWLAEGRRGRGSA